MSAAVRRAVQMSNAIITVPGLPDSGIRLCTCRSAFVDAAKRRVPSSCSPFRRSPAHQRAPFPDRPASSVAHVLPPPNAVQHRAGVLPKVPPCLRSHRSEQYTHPLAIWVIGRSQSRCQRHVGSQSTFSSLNSGTFARSTSRPAPGCRDVGHAGDEATLTPIRARYFGRPARRFARCRPGRSPGARPAGVAAPSIRASPHQACRIAIRSERLRCHCPLHRFAPYPGGSFGSTR